MDLLIATMEAVNDAEAGRGEATLAQFEQVIRFLWSASPNTGRPEITLFGVDRPFGRASMPVTPDAPMIGLSVTWRCSTLLTIAQVLDIGSARSEFGLPSEWLMSAIQKFGSKEIPDPIPLEQQRMKPRKKELPLRSDTYYLRLATAAMKDPKCWPIATLNGRNRSRALSRLARNILVSIADGEGKTPQKR